MFASGDYVRNGHRRTFLRHLAASPKAAWPPSSPFTFHNSHKWVGWLGPRPAELHRRLLPCPHLPRFLCLACAAVLDPGRPAPAPPCRIYGSPQLDAQLEGSTTRLRGLLRDLDRSY